MEWIIEPNQFFNPTIPASKDDTLVLMVGVVIVKSIGIE